MRRRLALGSCLAVALSITVAGAAGAAVVTSGGIKYVTKQFTLKPGGARTTKAACPKRTHVYGGGHYNVGGFGDVIGAHSYPYDGDDRDKLPDDGWAAQLRALGDSYDAAVHAICAKPYPEYAKRTAVGESSDQTLVSVPCDPPNLEVTDGGSRGPATVREVGAQPYAATQWQQGLANTGGGAPRVTVYAICTTYPGGPSYLSSAPVAAAGRTQAANSVGCGGGPTQRVVGGAVWSDGIGPVGGLMAVAATRPFGGAGGWEAWMDNYNFSMPVDVRVTSMCLKAHFWR